MFNGTTRQQSEMASAKQDSTNNSSAEKVLKLLMAFSTSEMEMGTTELSVRLGMHKSTTSRLIKTLVCTGFLQQNPTTRKYLLGMSAYRLGYAATRTLNTRLLAVAHPYLYSLAQHTGESVAMEMVSGINIILASQVEGPSHLRFNFQQGEVVPINVAAGAKAILAHSSSDFRETCLQGEFKRFNPRTIVSKQEYRELLKQIKATGVAYDRGERYTDIYAMAVPILLTDGSPKAAVVIAGPASRLTDAFLKSADRPLRETAAKISELLHS
ncbi:MAG: IclR family transcriptional regulator [Desulfofustis sp.]|jgi:DNA-binding IclR family transcriptional regulator